ncbi:MAG: hypothetical protein QOJ83_820 [Frankiales bacterium]|nr:hypothetical protein [Frankiales bacterium]
MTDDELADVTLLDTPVELRARSQQHSDELLREMTLIALQIREGDGNALPVRLTELVTEVQLTYGRFSAQTDVELDNAAARGDKVAPTIVYRVPRTVGPFARHLIEVLEETDEFCREGSYLLALAAPPDIRAFRLWALTEFERQIAGEAPMPWPEYARRNGIAG